VAHKTDKQRTRQRLIRGVLVTIQRQGVEGLTTGRVASLSGIAQPTFYAHFRNMDEALEEAASKVVGRFDVALSTDPRSSKQHPAVVLHEAVKQCTRALVADATVADVFLRCRRHRGTPLGRAWALLMQRLHDRMRDLVFRVRPAIAPPIATLHAEMLIGLVLSLAEGSVEGRIRDLDQATLIASRAIVASVLSKESTADAA